MEDYDESARMDLDRNRCHCRALLLGASFDRLTLSFFSTAANYWAAQKLRSRRIVNQHAFAIASACWFLLGVPMI
jgi:hypothetical protein